MSAPAKPIPPQLGKYRVLDVLGEGAMGVVYRAHDPSIDREVAVKTIHKELLADRALTATLIERFRREAVAAGRLSHPGIVAVYDYGDAGDVAYIVMELAPGESLHDYVLRRGSLPLGEIGAIMAQLLDALGYAHERGVVHRDIKPSNLLISKSGRVKITDFGIARISSSELTHSGAAVGTPSYMAPEQYAGGAIDHRADLFAVGVMLYELLTGARPFRGETIETLAYQIVHAPHLPPRHHQPSLPARLDAVLATALAKQPSARYSSAAELARGIAAAMAETTSTESAETAEHARIGLAATMLGGRSPSSPDARALPPFLDTETLHQVELALAEVLGPLSGALVRRCAVRATDIPDFIDALCRNAATPADRSRIADMTNGALARVKAARKSIPAITSRLNSNATATFVPSTRPLAPPPTPTGTASRVVTPQDADRVTSELARFVGPIARVLVKKALPKATDVRTLCTIVAAGIEREADRAKFLEAMKIR
jgi:serine/threonine-protein kinase